MDAREERGRVIAATCKIIQHRPPHSRRFYVPSASQDGRKYTVDMSSADNPTCTCPDYEEREMKCKHIYAVLYRMEMAENPDGSTTVTESITLSETIERKTTYKQDWPAY